LIVDHSLTPGALSKTGFDFAFTREGSFEKSVKTDGRFSQHKGKMRGAGTEFVSAGHN